MGSPQRGRAQEEPGLLELKEISIIWNSLIKNNSLIEFNSDFIDLRGESLLRPCIIRREEPFTLRSLGSEPPPLLHFWILLAKEESLLHSLQSFVRLNYPRSARKSAILWKRNDPDTWEGLTRTDLRWEPSTPFPRLSSFGLPGRGISVLGVLPSLASVASKLPLLYLSVCWEHWLAQQIWAFCSQRAWGRVRFHCLRSTYPRSHAGRWFWERESDWWRCEEIQSKPQNRPCPLIVGASRIEIKSTASLYERSTKIEPGSRDNRSQRE